MNYISSAGIVSTPWRPSDPRPAVFASEVQQELHILWMDICADLDVQVDYQRHVTLEEEGGEACP